MVMEPASAGFSRATCVTTATTAPRPRDQGANQSPDHTQRVRGTTLRRDRYEIVAYTEPRNRHGRACPGHPRLNAVQVQGVDGRDKPGHDDVDRLRAGPTIQCSFTCGSVRRVMDRAMVSSPTFNGPCSAASCI